MRCLKFKKQKLNRRTMPVLTRKIFAIFIIILNYINAYFEFLIDIRVN